MALAITLTISTLFSLVFNRFVQPTVSNGEGASGFHEYQIQFVKNLIDDSLDEFRYCLHEVGYHKYLVD